MKKAKAMPGRVEPVVMPNLSFQDALKILDIEDYGERIFNSNSHGELFHMMDYIQIADIYRQEKNQKWFRRFRPSVFQHIGRIFNDAVQRGA